MLIAVVRRCCLQFGLFLVTLFRFKHSLLLGYQEFRTLLEKWGYYTHFMYLRVTVRTLRNVSSECKILYFYHIQSVLCCCKRMPKVINLERRKVYLGSQFGDSNLWSLCFGVCDKTVHYWASVARGDAHRPGAGSQRIERQVSHHLHPAYHPQGP